MEDEKKEGLESEQGLPEVPELPPMDAEIPPVANPTPSEAFAMGAQYFSGPEWDLAVIRAANAIRRDPERFKAVRALPGGGGVN